MKRKEPTLIAMEKVHAVVGGAKALGWSPALLHRLARTLEDHETLGEVTGAYIEILGGPCRQFFLNFEKAERDAHEMLACFAGQN